ncbi:methyl-accepting chemotaxis protein [Reinekea thalattae]|uniref:Methyl-accepting transducer domain-containing protein n=1 Tax=Reinekea thalattae TaxID=2593301 RepID=A0A5C8ZA96_9GAMM|nr:methyl-accepting chemotaxis protein [Reinekea thalattae]TXR54344.1 hypothetical protein FME95_07355 [Reinekea thalattae]
MTSQFGALRMAVQARRQMTWLTVSALLMLVLTSLVLLFTYVQSRYDSAQRDAVAALRQLAPQLQHTTMQAARGQSNAFSELVTIEAEFERHRVQLLKSPMPSYLSALDHYFIDIDSALLNQTWLATTEAVRPVLENKSALLLLANADNAVLSNREPLAKLYTELVELLAADSPTPRSLMVARQVWLLDKMQGLLDNLTDTRGDVTQIVTELEQSLAFYRQVFQALQTTDARLNIAPIAPGPALNTLLEIDQLDDSIELSLQSLLDNRLGLITAEQALNRLKQQTMRLHEQVFSLPEQARSLTLYGVHIGFVWAFVLVALTIVLVLIMVVLTQRYAHRSLRNAEQTNQQHQSDILQLLDELAVLAEGDLTAQMSLTGGFTGTIAEAINVCVDQIRHRINAIQEAAIESTVAATEVQTMTQHLAEASRRQAEEIGAVATAVKHDALSAEQLQHSAQDTVAAAKLSMNAITQGFGAVQEAIADIDQLLPQIEDSAMRAKRLVQTISKIGEIVTDMNELTEQTNILAVNASIQSSVAGNAGRGFSAIAEQVQRLAERSSETTKQIGTLVKSIQNDTEETANAISQTTEAAERGVYLVKDTGAIFDEIERVSASLVELTQNIAQATVQQASSAGHVSTTMDVIQEIATQTSIGTKTTAESAVKVLRRSKKLHQTIDRLKLVSNSPQTNAETMMISELNDTKSEVKS